MSGDVETGRHHARRVSATQAAGRRMAREAVVERCAEMARLLEGMARVTCVSASVCWKKDGAAFRADVEARGKCLGEDFLCELSMDSSREALLLAVRDAKETAALALLEAMAEHAGRAA